MGKGQTEILLHHVRKVVASCAERRSDRELLRCFAQHDDQSAFAELVRRHGAMVFGVCRRILHDYHDAEDAFQTAFLTLARKAASRKWHESVGPWLHRVASRLAPAEQGGGRPPARTESPRRQAHTGRSA